MTWKPRNPTRRDLLAAAGLLGAHHLLFGRSAAHAAAHPGGEVLVDEPWAEIVQLADGVWAVVSTPLESDDWKTLSCGGFVGGGERVLAIEAFLRDEGAAWVAERAAELAGRRPTDVLVTHYHGDHVGGLAGYARGEDRPRIWMTRATLDLVLEDDADRETKDPVRAAMLEAVEILDADRPTELDLGGRRVALHPRGGHTASDVSVELDEPDVVFCGDLVWSGIFPNYRDTTPTELAASVRAMRREPGAVYVPGHGPPVTDDGYQIFVDLIDSLETAARAAVEKGMPLAEAAAAYRLPSAAAGWHLFRESYFETALGAWFEELHPELDA